jgi:signal transduction histidine kinase
LGLAIVRDVAEQHGGTACARTREGGGLIVTMTLSAVGQTPGDRS